MFDKLSDLPLLVAGPTIVGFLCLYSVIGLVLVRRFVLPRLRIQVEDGEFSGSMVQAVMVFYGLAVALIAVSVWQSSDNASAIVSQEASALAVLYRNVDCYPEPLRTQIQDKLREYNDQVIHKDWPLHQHGKLPTATHAQAIGFQKLLLAFKPVEENDKIMQAATIRAYDELIKARRLRLDAVGTRLPSILWFVIVAGALISLGSAFFFKLEDARVHAIQVVLLAAFMGLVIFMIFALDRPFHGDLGVKPDSYQLIYDQLMKPETDTNAAPPKSNP